MRLGPVDVPAVVVGVEALAELEVFFEDQQRLLDPHVEANVGDKVEDLADPHLVFQVHGSLQSGTLQS